MRDAIVDYDRNADLCKRNKPVECRRIPFFISTGTSNIMNFPGMLLPFLSLTNTMGWLRKDHSRDVREGQAFYTPNYYALHNFIMHAIKHDDEKDYIRSSDLLSEFLSRFGCWDQIQVSASFSAPLWDHKVFAALRRIALTHNSSFKPPAHYKSDIAEKYYSETIVRPDLNVRGGVDRSDRFYRADGIIQHRDYPSPIYIFPATREVELVNTWLRENGALCGSDTTTDDETRQLIRKQSKQPKQKKQKKSVPHPHYKGAWLMPPSP